jgi:4-hydroxy-tetrahydrodipicolinate reductase
MKIALIGYGKMGKAIEEIALFRGHTISHRFDAENPFLQHFFTPDETDIAIEFTRPELAVPHIHHALSQELPIVVGTTAWHDDLPAVVQQVEAENGALLHASNFSVGVNILFALNKKLAQLMSIQPYHASIEEIHHLQKLDAPSGTAVSLAKDIIENHSSYQKWELVEGIYGNYPATTLPVSAIREPDVPGTHVVNYESEVDSISLIHEAHNRKGFATGAVIAAEFLFGKKGTFTMSDVLNL